MFTHLSAGELLGCSLILIVVNNISKVVFFVLTYACSFYDTISRSEIAELYGNFKKYYHMVF